MGLSMAQSSPLSVYIGLSFLSTLHRIVELFVKTYLYIRARMGVLVFLLHYTVR